MATAVTRARYIQMGKETTPGTGVPATKRYPGNLTFTEEIDYYEPPYPQQNRFGGIAGQLVNVRNGFKGSYESELSFEELITFLAMCVKGGVSPTGTTDKTWTFTAPATASPALTTYTLEFAENDWTTQWARQVPYVFSPKMTLSGARNEVCKLNVELVGQKVVSGTTPTGSLSNWAGREIAKANLFKLYIDDAYGSLGGTQKTLSLLSWKVDIMGGVEPETTLDGQTGLDFTTLRIGEPSMETELTFLYNGSADTEIGKWRTGAYRAVRLIGTGTNAVSVPRSISIDQTAEYVSGAVIGSQDGNDIVTLKLKAKYQTGYTKGFEIAVINALTALA